MANTMDVALLYLDEQRKIEHHILVYEKEFI
jgi:hypothetical protein